MTQIASTPIAGMLGAADTRAPADAATPSPEQAAQFASMLAALVMALDPAVDPAEETAPALSELDATDDQGDDISGSGEERAADAESLVAASRAMAASVAATLEPVRAQGALEPQFREKLTRVVERMRALGHEVSIVETVRSQERQEKLFAQGRSEDGPVVTWTRRSRHTEGRAADVMVDGRYDGPGYRTLHRIATEEGLRTLGARDPGHLELPHATGEAGIASASPRPIDTTRERVLESLTATAGLGARVESAATVQTASVARVATIAEVAQVATVAQVAQTSVGVAQLRESVRAVPRRPATEEGMDGASGRDESAARLDLLTQSLNARGGMAGSDNVGELGSLSRALGASQLDQVNRVLAAQEAVRGRPLTELSLAMDGAESGVDRILVGMSGRTVGATFAASDALSARRLGGRMEELTRALERAGLEAGPMRVDVPEPRDLVRELGGRSVPVSEAGRGAGTDAQDRQQEDLSREREAWSQEGRQQSGGRHRSRRDQQETPQ